MEVRSVLTNRQESLLLTSAEVGGAFVSHNRHMGDMGRGENVRPHLLFLMGRMASRVTSAKHSKRN